MVCHIPPWPPEALIFPNFVYSHPSIQRELLHAVLLHTFRLKLVLKDRFWPLNFVVECNLRKSLKSRPGTDYKVAPSFSCLNINMPIFNETVFKLFQEDVVKIFC